MNISDRIYSAYRDYLRAIKELRDQGLSKFIESRRYRKIRQTYLEYIATFVDPLLDKRVNDLLQKEAAKLKEKEDNDK